MLHETVVLVLDDKEMFEFMAPVIRQELHTQLLIHCDNFDAAMRWINSDRAIDFIFCNWDLGGAEFVRAVRGDAETHHSPLIVITDSDRDDFIAAAMRLGASDILTRPFIEKALANKIHRVLHNRERRLRQRFHVEASGGTMRVLIDETGSQGHELIPIDISINGARARAPLTICEHLRIYHSVHLKVCAENFCLELPSSVVRIEHDPSGPAPGEMVIYAFRFHDIEDSQLDQLRDLLETLHQGSERGERGGVEMP